MDKRNIGMILLPTVLAAGLVGGIFIGRHFGDHRLSPAEEKLRQVLGLIDMEYVDDVDIDSLLDMTYPRLLSMLDPHSAYIPASELTAVNDELDGSFSGVGVSFQILNDTVTVIDVVAGGPAEKVGLLPGDKILKADTVSLTGADATNERVFKNLRGKNGTEVTLKVMRASSSKPLTYTVTRGEVPNRSVDAIYLLDDNTGYVRVSKFATTTYEEFLGAITGLQSRGAEKFVIDLRGNTGGYMDQAIMMANEFLPDGALIVRTKYKNPQQNTAATADGSGHFASTPIVVLTDEISASASEIFAGAIQDNDRGLVVGRRTFGKGLVQNQTQLPDNSAIRLTVARYYTPSGRSIQKEYKRGADGSYEQDIANRYAHGEFYSADSIKLDRSKLFHTASGREVFGGGGIMPDVFVPEDTTGVTSYYISVLNAGLIQKYAYRIAENYRQLSKSAKTPDQLLRLLPRDNTLLQGFVKFAASNGVPARWYYIRQSQNLILGQLKAVIVRDILGYSAFIEVLNRDDKTVQRALDLLRSGKSPARIPPK